MDDVSYGALSRFYVRTVIKSGECSTVISTVKTITVNGFSTPGTVSGGNTVCGSGGGILKLIGYSGKIQWQYSTDGFNFSDVGNGSSTTPYNSGYFTSASLKYSAYYSVSAVTTNTYFRAKVANGACSTEYSNIAAFIIGVSPSAGVISGVNSVCYGTGTTLTLNGVTGAVQWEKSTNGGSAWSTLTGKNTTTLVTGNLIVTTTYRAKVTVCSSVYTENYTVIVNKALAKLISSPNTLGSSSSLALCDSFTTSKVLNVGIGYVGAITWEISATGLAGSWSPIAGASGESYTINQAIVGVNYYRARFSTAPCAPNAFSNMIRIYYKSCSTNFTKFAENEISQKSTISPFEVMAYPNPYSESFNLKLTTSSDAIVGVTVYDVLGKLLEQREVRPTEVPEINIGDYYPSGIYNIIVNQGEEVKTLRVIKK
jgi:hypothetical protein